MAEEVSLFGDEEDPQNIDTEELEENTILDKSSLAKFLYRDDEGLMRSLKNTGINWYSVTAKAFDLLVADKDIKTSAICEKLKVSPRAFTQNIDLFALKNAANKLRLKQKKKPLKSGAKTRKRAARILPRKVKKGLSTKERLFVTEIIKDFDAGKAAIRAGYKHSDTGRHLLQRDDINAAIDAEKEAQIQRGVIDIHQVITRAQAEAELDINEITTIKIGCCEYCWGENHNKQWRDADHYESACEQAAQDEKPFPSCAGGFGYDFEIPQNPKCPRCLGKGKRVVIIKDTSQMSDVARRSIVSIEETKHGVRIKTFKEQSKQFVQQITGTYIEKNLTRDDKQRRIELMELQIAALRLDLQDNDENEKPVSINYAIGLNPQATKRDTTAMSEDEILDLSDEDVLREIDKGLDD